MTAAEVLLKPTQENQIEKWNGEAPRVVSGEVATIMSMENK